MSELACKLVKSTGPYSVPVIILKLLSHDYSWPNFFPNK